MSNAVVLRRPQQRRFLTSYSDSLAGLVCEVEQTRTALVSDLSLGPARPHHIAHELAQQLGIELHTRPMRRGGDSAQNIDRELRGDPGRIAALDHAERFAVVLDPNVHHVVVVGPRFNDDWGDANETFLRFVADLLSGPTPGITLLLRRGRKIPPLGQHRSRATSTTPPLRIHHVDAIHAGRPGIVPANVPGTVAGAAVAVTRLGARVVEPMHRRPDSDHLPPRVPGMHDDDDYALALAEHVYSRTGTCEALYALQRARLQAHSFVAAATQAPDFVGPEVLRREILGTIGYAAAMRGDPEYACLVLRASSPGVAPSESPDLYLRNTYALALARAGNHRAALAVERRLCADLAGIGGHWHLSVLNLLNLARLYRALGWTAKARTAFLTWERAIAGHAAEAELLYCNATLARIAQHQGDALEASRRWLRTALHWVSNARPEAMNWRTTSALVSGTRTRCDVDEVCTHLIDALSRSARAAGFRVEQGMAPPTFVYSSRALPLDACVIGRGVSVLSSATPIEPIYDSDVHRDLRSLVAAVLRANVGGRWDAPLIAIDAAHGYDLPSTQVGGRESATRHDVKLLVSASGMERWTPALDSFEVTRSDAVEAIVRSRCTYQVRFKRHWDVLRLSQMHGRIAEQIAEGPPIQATTLSRRALRYLEQHRVVRVRATRRSHARAT